MNSSRQYPDVELHNIVELDDHAGYPGPLVRRYPRSVSEKLFNGALVAENASLCEIRFVRSRGRRLAVSVTSLEAGELFVYRGDLLQTHLRLPSGELVRHVIDFENDPFARLVPEATTPSRFSTGVWRIVLDGPTLLHGIDRMGCVLRPPCPDEKPRVRWLAYGSSITHGFSPVSRRQCYVAQTAWRLGWDVLNLGLSGACFCEPEVADYLASRDDWDIITCELGVNMRGSVEPDEFDRRARYLVNTLTKRRPGKPVVLVSPFTTAADLLREPDAATRRTLGYAESLRAIAAEHAARQVHFIDGRDILPDITGLTCDLVHPSTEGHTTMSERLAPKLHELLNAAQSSRVRGRSKPSRRPRSSRRGID
jgi:lysophospholipase L1-like esterase